MNRWSTDLLDLQTLSELELLIPILQAAPVEADLWDAQNSYYELMKAMTGSKLDSLSETWLQLFRSVGAGLGDRGASKSRLRQRKEIWSYLGAESAGPKALIVVFSILSGLLCHVSFCIDTKYTSRRSGRRLQANETDTT